ncbi:MAG TPA: hypothetical protein VFP32_01270 [Candidatus Saccharimonadales bacterium]|nr:hypothetical protein [Candidatus Saccharimonadales bacterium]
MAKKSNRSKWFVPVRGSYLPNNWLGWLTYLPFTAYLILTLVLTWSYTSNLAKTILVVAIFWVVGAAVMTWLARRTS